MGSTALTQAAEQGHADCVRLLVESGADFDAADCCNRTALTLAAEKGRTDCVRLLVEGGANLEAKDDVRSVMCILVICILTSVLLSAREWHPWGTNMIYFLMVHLRQKFRFVFPHRG